MVAIFFSTLFLAYDKNTALWNFNSTPRLWKTSRRLAANAVRKNHPSHDLSNTSARLTQLFLLWNCGI